MPSLKNQIDGDTILPCENLIFVGFYPGEPLFRIEIKADIPFDESQDQEMVG